MSETLSCGRTGLWCPTLPTFRSWTFDGNSRAGGPSLQFAMDHPSRVDRLVLMAPGGGALAVTSPGEIEQRVGRLLVAFLRDPTRERMKDFIEHMACDRSHVTE